MKPLIIFTPVWGEWYIKLLKEALGRSMRWPRNFDAIKDAKWVLMIHASEFDKVVSEASLILPLSQINTIEIAAPISELTSMRGKFMNECVVKTMRMCLDQNAQFLMATPDFVYGDGTLENMRKLAVTPNICVSMDHPRALPEILDYIKEPRTNHELRTISKKHEHMSWTSSKKDKFPSGTRIGGILWRQIKDDLVSVQHRMPSPYLCNIAPQDIDFFTTETPGRIAAFGGFDHDWPAALVEQGRFRRVLSSDACYMAEVTKKEDNVPGLEPINTAEPDAFALSNTHNKTNRQFISCFRG